MQQFNNLKRNQSLHLRDGFQIYIGSLKIDLDYAHIGVQGHNKEYNERGGVISYVHNGELFVTPYLEESRKILEDSGFKKGGLYVPLSKGGMPAGAGAADKWRHLKEAPLAAS